MTTQELSVELGSDEGGFLVHGLEPSIDVSPALPDNTLAEWWPDAEPEFEGFMISTGSQWGPFDVLLRVLDAPPGPAADRWQDVIEISVNARQGAVSINEIVDGPVGELAGLAGTYRMRIAALGRAESDARDRSYDDDSETALEHYLLELWPSEATPAEVVRESQHARDINDPPAPDEPDEKVPGLKAAWTIIRDLRGEAGARPLPGDLGALTVTLELPGTKDMVFKRLRDVFGWPPCLGGSGSPDLYAPAFFDATVPDSAGNYDTVGAIETTLIAVDEPNRIVKRWNWLRRSGGSIDSWPRLLATDSTVTLTVEQSSASGEEPQVHARLIHDGIPEAWIQDLERLWTWHLVIQAAR